MTKTRDTEASVGISSDRSWKRLTHMEFEHVTFDLPHGTFHALQGGDLDGQPMLVLHGFPDHPPTARPFLAELGRRGRQPQQNAYVERYNRTVRHEWLDLDIFDSITQVQEIATQWLWTYNHERPNMGIGGIHPLRN